MISYKLIARKSWEREKSKINKQAETIQREHNIGIQKKEEEEKNKEEHIKKIQEMQKEEEEGLKG